MSFEFVDTVHSPAEHARPRTDSVAATIGAQAADGRTTSNANGIALHAGGIGRSAALSATSRPATFVRRRRAGPCPARTPSSVD